MSEQTHSDQGDSDRDLRSCLNCGAPVECEPGYPRGVRVACVQCIQARQPDCTDHTGYTFDMPDDL